MGHYFLDTQYGQFSRILSIYLLWVDITPPPIKTKFKTPNKVKQGQTVHMGEENLKKKRERQEIIVKF